jgi:4-amino-4-deoxy-L-arabinose transferase-like glycosyltransferase
LTIITEMTTSNSRQQWWRRQSPWWFLLVFVLTFPMAFLGRGIYIDEAWIGEQAHALLNSGTIVTSLMRDLPPLDQQIVIYHKLLVWLGVASSAVFGWGLYSLRLVSAVAGVIGLAIFYIHLARAESKRLAAIATVILLWTPLYWEMMRIYRPEMLVTCVGLSGYALLCHARARGSILLLAIAGLLCGLAGTAHPAGLAFAAAGFVALLFHRQYRWAAVFLIAALIGFFPYVSAFVTNYDLAVRQMFHNETMSAMVTVHWWSPIVNLLEEHKRIFRQPMVVGISVMFVLSLLMTRRQSFKQHAFFWIYLAVLFFCGAIAPFPKISRYMLPLIPFFAIASARTLDSLLEGDRFRFASLRFAFVFWTAVFGLYGAYALINASLFDRQASMELTTHRLLGQSMDKGSLVMATPKFIFPEIDSFTIQSYGGALAAAKSERTLPFLEDYASSHAIRYLIVDQEVMLFWHFDLPRDSARFQRYRPLVMLPERGYYLFEKSK